MGFARHGASMNTADGFAMSAAASAALQSIDQFIGENHEGLSVPMTTLNQAISNLIEGNGKAIKGLTSRVVKAIDRHVVTNDEQVDSALTTLLQGIDAWLSSQEYALTLMSSKGGLLEIGEPLAAVLAEDAAQGKQLAYQGTLVLSIREAEGKIDELIEVLREIRDRMPGQPVQWPGETPALGEDDVIEPTDQDDLAYDPAPVGPW